MENLKTYINKQLKLLKEYYEVLKELYSQNSNYYCEYNSFKNNRRLKK